MARADESGASITLTPALRVHLEKLASQTDQIAEQYREPSRKLAEWIAKNYRPTESLSIVIVCTGNSRRSVLGSLLGNAAAAYVGMPEVRFYSGGTAPSAFNERTIRTLLEIGFRIDSTGMEAPRGAKGDPNPVYSVRWSEPEASAGQSREFSKRYSDAANPQRGFAAVLVCNEAGQECPTVPGAAIRIPMPFDDPKAFDGTPIEAAKYAERRDDIGRILLQVMLTAKKSTASV